MGLESCSLAVGLGTFSPGMLTQHDSERIEFEIQDLNVVHGI